MRSILSQLVGFWGLHPYPGDTFSTDRVPEYGSYALVPGAASAAEGKISGAHSFAAASSQAIATTNATELRCGDVDFTVCAWVYLSSKGAVRSILARDGNVGGDREFRLYFDNVADRFKFGVFKASDTEALVTSSLGSPSLSTWYFLIGWHDATNDIVGIEANGIIDTAATGGALQAGISNTFFAVGYRATAVTNFWDGRICEVGFWKRMLTAQERAWLYNGGIGRTLPADGRFSNLAPYKNRGVQFRRSIAPGPISF